MIKVLIVDDSAIMRESLALILNSDPIFEIVGFAKNGKEAIELTKEHEPDVITMDWQMPVLNGYEATKEIMATKPTPIVVVTGSVAANDVSISFSLMEAGALVVIKKPHAINHPSYRQEKADLIESIKLMSEIKLVRRTNGIKNKSDSDSTNKNKKYGKSVIAIGASTGGPISIKKLLTNMPEDINLPIVVVQHISLGFINGFAEWLMNSTNFPIHIAFNGEKALPGHVYLAPDDKHLGIDSSLNLYLSDGEKENGLRPSVSYLFRSCAENLGSKTIGILLSGMGKDGSHELKLLRDKGGLTYAQDEKSSIVHGMPGEAIRIDAAKHVYPPEEIGRSIKHNLKF